MCLSSFGEYRPFSLFFSACLKYEPSYFWNVFFIGCHVSPPNFAVPVWNVFVTGCRVFCLILQHQYFHFMLSRCQQKERVIHLTFIGVRQRARKLQMGRYLLSVSTATSWDNNPFGSKPWSRVCEPVSPLCRPGSFVFLLVVAAFWVPTSTCGSGRKKQCCAKYACTTRFF